MKKREFQFPSASVAFALRLIALLAFASIMLGCREKVAKTDDRLFLLSAGNISLTKLRLNGEPAVGGSMITLFVVNGQNDLVLEGEVQNGVQIMFGRCESPMGKNWQSMWNVDERFNAAGGSSGFQLQTKVVRAFQHRFEADVSWHWTWQDADVIPMLTDSDKQAILMLFGSFARDLTNTAMRADGLMDPEKSIPWVRDDKRIAQTQKALDDLLAKVRAYKDITSQTSALEDLMFDKGNKLVVLRTTDEYLYYLGPREDYHPKPGEAVWSISGDRMYFARFRGIWKQVLLVQ